MDPPTWVPPVRRPLARRTTKRRIVQAIPIGGTKFDLSCLGLSLYARRYLKGARVVRDPDHPGFDPVPYALYCHSIELSLKAFLWIRRGRTIKQLKDDYSHRLNQLWRDAGAAGLGSAGVSLTPARHKVIRDASTYHSDRLREFQYMNAIKTATGHPGLPDIEVLDRLAARLDHVVHPLAVAHA